MSILICYDGSPRARRAVEVDLLGSVGNALALRAGRPALFALSGPRSLE